MFKLQLFSFGPCTYYAGALCWLYGAMVYNAMEKKH